MGLLFEVDIPTGTVGLLTAGLVSERHPEALLLGFPLVGAQKDLLAIDFEPELAPFEIILFTASAGPNPDDLWILESVEFEFEAVLLPHRIVRQPVEVLLFVRWQWRPRISREVFLFPFALFSNRFFPTHACALHLV